MTQGQARTRATNSLVGAVIAGYQGWFGCPGDAGGTPAWRHWFRADGSLSVDMLPDVRGLPADSLSPTPLHHADGSPVMVFSARAPDAVLQHFRLMQRYGIHGVALQRFLTALKDPAMKQETDRVLENVRSAAEATGRTFFIDYDISGAEAASWHDDLLADWADLTRRGQVTSSPSYQHHGDRPVLGVWGLAVEGRPGTPWTGRAVLSGLAADPGGSPLVIAGVPWNWRKQADEGGADGWASVFDRCGVISPWTVGAFRDEEGARQFHATYTVADMAAAAGRGQLFMPVVFPGYSAANLQRDPGWLNLIPRRHGRLFEAQVDSLCAAGARTIYVAMFDEVDEGTAIMPTVADASELPRDATVLASDTGDDPDFYLRLAGKMAERLPQP